MIAIHVVGVGLEGADGLSPLIAQLVEQAILLVGSPRHLAYFPHYAGDRLVLTDLHQALQTLQNYLPPATVSSPHITILTSGDPLFFGFGRLLLETFPPEQLTFHPHLSAIQLAFSRIKLPWQDARVISAHGRSLDELTQALQQGIKKIAVLTDDHNSPNAIAELLQELDLPTAYQLWICENLGGADERVQQLTGQELIGQQFAPLNVVVLVRQESAAVLELESLPTFGLPDSCFLSFSDRPGLMTKREIRLLVLGELALQPGQIIWDIGAGTGSVSIEIARLFPNTQIYAIEQTAAGITLIQQNSQRFQVESIQPIQGKAPTALQNLPQPDRIFIGGSGGSLTEILSFCSQQLRPQGVIVLALATLEHQTQVQHWLGKRPQWQFRLLQAQLARSVPVAALTRLSPLNPVTLVTLSPVEPSPILPP
jgi:precorrin-6Y C5,15-methyltransferase (decarboxylating)